MPVNLLYTGSIEKEFFFDEKDIQVDFLPLISIQWIKDDLVLTQLRSLESQHVLVVLTSQYAVHFLDMHLSSKPNWRIACLEGATLQQIEKIGLLDLVQYTAPNAQILANIILNKEKPQLLFFVTTSIRTSTLPDLLTHEGFVVKEMYVYENQQIETNVSKRYDGIVFLSPSAVHTFFKCNTIDQDTILFSIGHTTANEIAKYVNNKVIVSEKPTTQDIINSIQQFYFQK